MAKNGRPDEAWPMGLSVALILIISVGSWGIAIFVWGWFFTH